MAKDRKPTDEPSAFATQTMEQARNAEGLLFYLKKAVSASPSGGTEYGKKLKSCAEANLATTHEFVRRLSQRQDFEIAPERTGHGLPLSKCEAYNRVYDRPYESR